MYDDFVVHVYDKVIVRGYSRIFYIHQRCSFWIDPVSALGLTRKTKKKDHQNRTILYIYKNDYQCREVFLEPASPEKVYDNFVVYVYNKFVVHVYNKVV